MRRTILTLLAIASPAIAQQQQGASAANVSVSAAKNVWMMSSSFVQRSAEQMPESEYAFQPTKDVRSFGQIIGHVADARYMFCAAALGEKSPQAGSFEKDATTKAALVQAMKDASAYCQRAYAQTDAASSEAITLFGMKMTRMGALIMNGAHDYEHYGNLVTYFRLKGMTPPSSQGQ
jgi:uncharacterized damage-inducible protein DinB